MWDTKDGVKSQLHSFYCDNPQLFGGVISPIGNDEASADFQLELMAFRIHQVGVAHMERVGSETVKLIEEELAV